MTRTPLRLVLVAVLAAAAPATAELSKLYVDWAAGPAQHLFTDADRSAWAAISDDEAAERFVRLFWARRDPTPATPDNEFRREFERRVALASQLFTEIDEETRRPGWQTDRGRAVILLGPPHRRGVGGSEGEGTGGDFGGPGSTNRGVTSGSGSGLFGRGGSQERFGAASEERWTYEDEHKPEWIKKKRFTVRFRTDPGTKAVELFQGQEALGFMAEAITRAVVSPALTDADIATLPASAGVEGEMRTFNTAAADAAAIEAMRSALAARAAASFAAHLDAGAFHGSDGKWIVPVQIASAAAPPAGATALIELAKTDGTSEGAFRVTGEWAAGGGQSYVEATLAPKPGEYEVRAALRGADGAILWSGREPVTVPVASEEFWISELLLSEQIGPMPRAQDPLEPYAWQGIKVVPKGGGVFAHGAALWAYLHACHPTLGADGKPTMRAILEVSGPAQFRGSIRGEAVKATDDCWVLAQAFDVGAQVFPPGDYTLEAQVTDNGRTLTSGAPFKVVAAP